MNLKELTPIQLEAMRLAEFDPSKRYILFVDDEKLDILELSKEGIIDADILIIPVKTNSAPVSDAISMYEIQEEVVNASYPDQAIPN